MSETKISQLNPITSATTDDLLVMVNDPADTNTTKKITVGNLQSSLTVAESQVTNLVSDLAGKSNVGHTHVKTDLTDIADFLLESEVDADIKTLSLPASTTISTFGASLVDDANAAAALTTLGAAAASHTHAAADVTSGTIATARLGSGTASSSTYLRGDQTWATVTAGGQTLFECIVAASGGDYTTVSAALTAGKTRIFVKSGTYTETAIVSNSATDVLIVGENPHTTVIDIGSYDFSISGARSTIQNMKFTSTTGVVTINGANSRVVNCEFTSSGTSNTIVSFISTQGLFLGNRVMDTASSSVSCSNRVIISGDYGRSIGNYFNIRPGTSSGVNAGHNNGLVANNVFEGVAAVSGRILVLCLGNPGIYTGNYIYSSGASAGTGTAVKTGEGLFTGNHVLNGNYGIEVAGGSVISGNRVTGSGQGSRIYISSGDATVTGNYVKGSGTSSGNIGINVTSSTATVSGNTISTVYDAIVVASGATDNAIFSNNVVSSIGNKAINDSGTRTRMEANTGLKFDATMTARYEQMKNTSGVSLAAGDLVIRKAVAAGNEVTTTTTAGDANVYGIAVETIANNATGNIQVFGKTTVLKANGTTDIAIGDYLTAYTTAGIAAKATTGDTAFAIALEVYTADDSSGVLDALLITPRKI